MKKDPHFTLGVLTLAAVGGTFGINAAFGSTTIVPLPDDVVIFAEKHVIIQKENNIVSGNVATNNTLVLENKTTLAESALSDTSTLQKDVTVSGNIETNNLNGQHFTILGATITPRTTPEFEISLLPEITPGTEDITIKKGETATIVAGNYDRIVIEKEATITLEEGTYHMNRLTIGKDTVITINNPITLNIRQSISTGDNTLFNINPNVDINEIRINVEGRGTISFKKNSAIAGILHAPNAAIFLGKQSQWRGQIAGRQVVVGKEGVVSREVSFEKPSDPTKVFENGEGVKFIVNEVIVLMTSGTTLSDIRSIADAVDGRITGFLDILEMTKIEIISNSIAEQSLVVQAIEGMASPFVEDVIPSFILR